MSFFDGIIDSIKEAVGGAAEGINAEEVTNTVQDLGGDATQQVTDAVDQVSQGAQDVTDVFGGSDEQ